MEDVLKQILTTLKTLDHRLIGLEQGQKLIVTGQKNVEQGIIRLEHRQERLEQGQEKLEYRQGKLEHRQEKLEFRQERLEERQEKLEYHQLQLKAGQETMQKNIVNSLGEFTDQIIEHVDDKTTELKQRIISVEKMIDRPSR